MKIKVVFARFCSLAPFVLLFGLLLSSRVQPNERSREDGHSEIFRMGIAPGGMRGEPWASPLNPGGGWIHDPESCPECNAKLRLE